MSYPASDPHAEPPTAVFPAGVYRSDAAAATETATGRPATEPAELSPEALRRLRARLLRKYH